jgi:hypothetical protein
LLNSIKFVAILWRGVKRNWGEALGANQQAELFIDMFLISLTMLILGGYALIFVDVVFLSV